jgi:hypothetical protein
MTIQGVAKNFRVRLLVSHESGVGDGAENNGNSTLPQHVFDSAIGIGDDRNLVAFADGAQLFGGAGTNRVPVGGVANTGDELVADGIELVFVFAFVMLLNADLGEQLRIKHPPETVIGAAVFGHDPIELILGAAFQVAQVLVLG